MVYADSMSIQEAPGYAVRNNPRYPSMVNDIEHSINVFRSLPCDIMITPHTEVADMWTKLGRREHQGDRNAFVDPEACKRYALTTEDDLRKALTTKK
jgi:metallo-beta-lactamase class B